MPLFSPRLRASVWQAGFALLDALPARQRRTTLPQHIQTGKIGEEAGFFFLRGLGLILIAHGWKSTRAPGDLDLVAWEKDTLCFIEVKTRSSRTFATAEAAVDKDKRRNLRRLARHYLRQLPPDTSSRFDILSIYLKPGQPPRKAEFELFRNAFTWEEPA